MSSHKSIIDFLDYIDSHLSPRSHVKGGTNATEPYQSYKSILDNIYEYVSFVFINDEKNKKELEKSIEELNRCKKYRNELCGKEEYVDISRTPIQKEEPEYEKVEEKMGVLLRKGEELE